MPNRPPTLAILTPPQPLLPDHVLLLPQAQSHPQTESYFQAEGSRLVELHAAQTEYDAQIAYDTQVACDSQAEWHALAEYHRKAEEGESSRNAGKRPQRGPYNAQAESSREAEKRAKGQARAQAQAQAESARRAGKRRHAEPEPEPEAESLGYAQGQQLRQRHRKRQAVVERPVVQSYIPAPPEIETGTKDTFHWMILIGPHTSTESRLYNVVHIYSRAGGYERKLEEELIDTECLARVVPNWPGYEVVCVLPPPQRRYWLVEALDEALGQTRRRWVVVFVEVLQRWGWINDLVAQRVVRGVPRSPWEPWL
ncbi:hypothetical protein BJX76DRAFT_354002 [Aspergillus varians]